ncbi:olfactory receptor 5AP2-like [Opisthocomus hoazin]|uniref:olfactory receptor 5AP2-like n=1 Tax=Opisthocomus hoazin TaxID=30419 RepID=UPI003F53510A
MGEGQRDNQTSPREVLLLGLGNVPELQTLLLLLTVMIYFVTVVGNFLIMVLVVADQHLHTPMYFFLGSLSFLETCYSSTILPRLLASFLTGDRTISAHDYMAQLYFFGSFATTECYLLAAMSYDRYLAICQPLLCVSLMTWKVCLGMSAVSCLVGSLVSAVVTFLFSQLQFCGPQVIDHFFCDFTPLLELCCSDIMVVKLITFFLFILDIIITLASYVCIIAAILRIPSSMGRQKAFSTCSSHLTVMTVCYGTLIIVYVPLRTAPLRQLNKVFSFFYTVLTPLVTPSFTA